MDNTPNQTTHPCFTSHLGSRLRAILLQTPNGENLGNVTIVVDDVLNQRRQLVVAITKIGEPFAHSVKSDPVPDAEQEPQFYVAQLSATWSVYLPVDPELDLPTGISLNQFNDHTSIRRLQAGEKAQTLAWICEQQIKAKDATVCLKRADQIPPPVLWYWQTHMQKKKAAE